MKVETEKQNQDFLIVEFRDDKAGIHSKTAIFTSHEDVSGNRVVFGYFAHQLAHQLENYELVELVKTELERMPSLIHLPEFHRLALVDGVQIGPRIMLEFEEEAPMPCVNFCCAIDLSMFSQNSH